MSSKSTLPYSSKSTYMARLQRAIDRYEGLDAATKALFLVEIDQHIEMLRESLETGGCRRGQSESKAISLMERPGELAQALCRADKTARESAPHRRLGNVLKAWTRYLQLGSTLMVASLLSVTSVLTAVLLGAVVPSSWQESMIVPAVAASVFGLTVFGGWWVEGRSRQVIRPAQMVWVALFGLGAQLATYSAETLSTLDFALARPSAYGALILTISFFAAASFAGLYFRGAGSRIRFFRTSFPAIFAIFLLVTVVLRGLVGAHHGTLFCLYTLFGMTAIFATRRYVAIQSGGGRRLEAGTV